MTSEQSALIEEEYWQGSARFYICLAGISGSLGMSTFDFSRSAGILDYSRIFLRDPQTSWYQHGLPGIGENTQDVVRFLEEKIAQSGARDVRFVGHCMGGFAAILLCALMRRGRAVAFAPQTHVITADNQPLRHETQPVEDGRVWDLAPWLRQNAPEIVADIYVARDFPYDVQQAKPLEGFRNIRVHYVEKGGHQLVLATQRDGLLAKLVA